MSNIKLYVCCHKPYIVPQHPLLFPVQVGTSMATHRIDGFLHDDSGNNISHKNKSYCELTALYWAWKNEQADYYGLFHYRRYLYPVLGSKTPYKVYGNPTAKILYKLKYGKFAQLIEKYDMIVPKGENLHISVWDHYKSAPFHFEKDLNIIYEVVCSLYPEYRDALNSYFNGTIHYWGNITIMSKAVFFDYCQWLFSILEEFDRRVNTDGYSKEALRVDGYLAERLLGVYYTKHRCHLNTLELPRVHFEIDRKKLLAKRAELFFFPTESVRRAIVKRIVKSIL